MHRTDAPGNVGGMYDAGDPLAPREATLIMPSHLNAFQEELCGTVEGLGGTLNKANNGQLLERLNAKYGRLDLANNWTGTQTFSADVTVGGTLFTVTPNASFGGTLGVTATTTLSGPANLNGVTTVNNTFTVGAFASVLGGTLAVTGTTTLTGSLIATNGTNTVQNLTVTNALGVGGSMNANGGITGTGSPGVAGGTFANGTAATAGTRRNAAVLTNGDLSFSGVVNPNATVAVSNTLTPSNIVKAWGLVHYDGLGTTPTLYDGFNVQSVTRSSNDFVITWATGFTTTRYAVIATTGVASGAADGLAVVQSQTASAVTLRVLNTAGAQVTSAIYIHFMVMGGQS